MFVSVLLNTVVMWFYPMFRNNEAFLLFVHRFSIAALVIMIVGVFLENLFKGE
jgi:hypothetical protein